jgi:hypothetical protein
MLIIKNEQIFLFLPINETLLFLIYKCYLRDIYIVIWRLKAGIMERIDGPLLGNGAVRADVI